MPEISELGAVFDRYPDRYRPRPDRYRPGNVTACESPGFSGAKIFKVETASGVFCLRGWPAQAPPIARIRGLHRLLAHIRDCGVSQVAVPIAAIDGQTLVDIQGRLWQLEPWMPGRADFCANPDFSVNPSDVRLQNAMRTLAAWHNAAATFPPTLAEAPWFSSAANAVSPTATERLERLRNWISGRLDELEQPIARSPHDEFSTAATRALRIFRNRAHDEQLRLQIAAGQRYSLQPCLRDVHGEHVLFTGDDVTGIIDPSACRSDHVAVDLARLLGSWFGTEARSWDVAFTEYRRHRSLTVEEAALAEVFNTSGLLLSALRWLERRFLEREAFPDPQAVLQRLCDLLNRLEPHSGLDGQMDGST